MEADEGSTLNNHTCGNCGFIITPCGVIMSILIPILLSMALEERRKTKKRGVHVKAGGETGITMRNAKFSRLVDVPWEGATTMAALFEQSCRKHSHARFLGTRKVIRRELVGLSEGRNLEKVHLDEYLWESYNEVFGRVCNFSSGLVHLGHDVETRVAIFSETRPEWLIAFQACCRQNITVVTIYTSLGDDAFVYSVNETEATTLVCDTKQLKKLCAISSSLKTIKNIIYFNDDDETASDLNIFGKWTVSSFYEVERVGESSPVHARLPIKSDLAIIMYTSGSTGLPKGVMITHGNIVATTAAVMNVIPNLGPKDVYLAYLPQAQVFELAAENAMLAAGASIGFGSQSTLMDTSKTIKKGTQGDASMLKPTLMAAVPTVLDCLREGIVQKVEEKGGNIEALFNLAYKRRMEALEGSWFGIWDKLETRLWDKIIFQKTQKVLGGEIRFMLSGGAPLSEDTQRFMNICIGAPIVQGYGLTETFAGGTLSGWDDTFVGHVGPPLPCTYIKLVSWKEGGYRITDKPMPRGEVVVGGYSVTAGYFNNDAETNNTYHVDERGMRWFYTGDIGRFHRNGCLEIIDRKKDITKLQHGEYISLGKVEAALRASKYVDSIMVYADPFHNYCVALVVPSREVLLDWADDYDIRCRSFSSLCDNIEAVKEVLQSLYEVGKAATLDRLEIPARIKLLPDPWSPESGLVTTTLKLKREKIVAKFKEDIHNMYSN
ncbi:unnamed protein product [Cuscuta epithymum]|uniref:AMP-dependent synthetase/ligase domain-containing protein n=1 Tax=Cuscuta epithymum TaxID=186058 RepID=A0AAV0F554_9ASTE|nr:unnamed protein product [Cuscuta epithymum]